jgi:tetratricopeptide (TPR) repeat protein
MPNRKRKRPEKIQLSAKEWVALLCLLMVPVAALVPLQYGQQLARGTPLGRSFRGVHRGLVVSSWALGSSVASWSAFPQEPSASTSQAGKHIARPVRKNKPLSDRNQIRKLFRKAQSLEKQGQWCKAVHLLKDILVLDPADAHSHLALARLEARRGGDACAIFKAGTEACPESVHLWQAWAVYEESARGNTAKSKELFERALELDPYNPYVCHAYGLLERKLGNSGRARRLWERALQKSSTAALVCSLGELFIAETLLPQARDLYMQNVVRLQTEREKTEVYLALAWLEERYFSNFDRAEESIETALSLSPRSSVAQVALARLEGRRQQRIQGRQQGKEVRDATVVRLASACMKIENGSLDKQPVDGRVYNAWAHMEVKAKRLHDARKILYRGLARYPNDHSLLQAAGKVEERMGNFTGARELYSASLSIQPSAPTLVAYALLDLRYPLEGTSISFNDTKRLFEEALLVDKRHGPAYNAYGRAVFEHQQDEDEARRIFERGVRVNCTDSASIYHGYARLELSLGNVNRARELLLEGNREVRRINVGTDSPHRERALFLTHTLGMLELNSNRPSASLEVFRDGIERYGNSSQLLLGAALCEVKLGNERKARVLFERSVLNDEKHAQAWQAWGVMEMRAGNLKTAKMLFECGIRSAPKHGALWHAYGVMENRLGNVENARALFKKGIEVAPSHVALYQSWASLELRECNYDAAKALISRSLTRDKRNGSGWLIAAEIEERLGNHGLGILLLRRGIECSPTNAQLYRALGDALVRQGKIIEAREIMEKGIEVDPMCAPLYHSLAELEARVFNIEGLAKLNKRAASIFNTNALEPAPSSSEVWGSKIRAGRSRGVPSGVAALAQRIVEEDVPELRFFDAEPSTFLDGLMSSSLLEEGLVGDLLQIGENGTDFSD